MLDPDLQPLLHLGTTQRTQGTKQVTNTDLVCKVPNWSSKGQRTNWREFGEKPNWFSDQILWSFGKGKDPTTQAVI